MNTDAHQDLMRRVVDCAIEVHRNTGPGLLAEGYAGYLEQELTRTGLSFVRKRPLTFIYDGTVTDLVFTLDFVVEEKLVVEVRAVDAFTLAHEQELFTHVRLGGFAAGLMVNFNAEDLNDGMIHIDGAERPGLDPETQDVFEHMEAGARSWS